MDALKVEARRLGIFKESRHERPWQISWRRETVIVRGKAQMRYRDTETGRFLKKPY
ncbi:hypothetical protein MUP37_06445 [Candidatus Bathyarchaeota archaeon]|nr:hypothetical protein [Candidatus Bathyarchaeota archaeon]